MLEAARRWLAELRAGADPRRFVEDGVANAEGDSASEARALLLLALQYDHDPGDAALLRLLLDAEITANAGPNSDGDPDELKLAAWLVAQLRDPADVFRMWRAKSANYDTFCGFDGEHLVAAGVARTLAHLHASDDPRRVDILEYLGGGTECIFDEADVVAWHAATAEWFPAREADESPWTKLERALRFAPAQAPRWLEAWLATQEPGDQTLSRLCGYAVQLGDFERAIAVARQRIELAGDSDDSVGLHESLARVLWGAGRLDEAEAALVQAATLAATRTRCAWDQRRSLESWLELAEVAAPQANWRPLAHRAFVRADRLFTAGFGFCFNNLERLAACAGAVGESEARTRLAAARDEEGRRIGRSSPK